MKYYHFQEKYSSLCAKYQHAKSKISSLKLSSHLLAEQLITRDEQYCNYLAQLREKFLQLESELVETQRLLVESEEKFPLQHLNLNLVLHTKEKLASIALFSVKSPKKSKTTA